MSYFVIKDSKEQLGWDFDKTENCLGMRVEHLPTGDYTIEGYETKVIIERKGSTGEFAKNINEGRFEAELSRMESFAFPFMVLEFTMRDLMLFPIGSGIPQFLWKKLRVTPFYMLRKLVEYELRYKTKIIFAGGYGKEFAASIFKRVIECQKNTS
jgi:hypothetical protein